MRPESILSEMLDRISTLEGVDPVEQRLLYERAQEALRYTGEIRAELETLRAQVAQHQRVFGEYGEEELKLFVSMDSLFAICGGRATDGE